MTSIEEFFSLIFSAVQRPVKPPPTIHISVIISVFNLFEKRESFCKEIKAGWNKKKIESAQISKEQEKISKEQEKLKKEQSKLSNCEGSDYKLWNNCKGSYKSKTGHKYTGLFMKGLIIDLRKHSGGNFIQPT